MTQVMATRLHKMKQPRRWLQRRCLQRRWWRQRRLERDVARFVQEGRRFEPRLTAFPPMVLLDTTTRCNLHCAHCPHSELAQQPGFLGDMDWTIFRKVIDEIAAEAPATATRLFDGGEPLLREDLEEMVRYAKRQGLRWVSINTNGTLLSPERGRALAEAGLDHLEVSIDATTPETYQKIRRCNLFERVVNNTMAYAHALRQKGRKQQVAVSFVLQQDNRDELDAFRTFWTPKVDRVNIREYHQHHDLVDAHGRLDSQQRTTMRHPCPYLWNRMIIHHDGRVRFCEGDWKVEHAVGNVQKESLRSIWHGANYTALRQAHVAGDFSHPCCAACTDWWEVRWPGMGEPGGTAQ